MKITPLYRQILLHVAWWVFYIGNYFVALYIRFPNPEWYVIDKGLEFLSLILFFYFYIHVTAKRLFNRQTLWIGVGLFIINAGILYATEASRLIWAYFAGFYDKMPKHYFQVHTLVLAFLRDVVQFTGYGTVYWFYNQFYKQQKEKLELEQRSHAIEIAFLKAQINEHFTYNMLSMFHAQATELSDELADGILSLSDLMRYSVSERPSILVALDEEVKYTQVLIALNRLRFGETVKVNFAIMGTTFGWQVPHLCILTLVENAFKHGNIKEAALELSLEVSAQKLRFTTKNKKKAIPSSAQSTGIGIKNLERRLQMMAKGHATLQSREDEDYFYSELETEKS